MREKKGYFIRAIIGIYLVFIGIRLLIEITTHEPSNMTFLIIFTVALIGIGGISTYLSIRNIFRRPDQQSRGGRKIRQALTRFFQRSREKAQLRSGDTMEMDPARVNEEMKRKYRKPEVRELKPEQEDEDIKWSEVTNRKKKGTIIELVPKEQKKKKTKRTRPEGEGIKIISDENKTDLKEK